MMLQPLEFNKFIEVMQVNSAKARAIAGDFMERLPGKSVAEWIREVEAEDAEVAKALRDHFNRVEKAGTNPEDAVRQTRIADVMGEIDALPWPGVEQNLPGGNWSFANFDPRPEFREIAEALEAVWGWVNGTGPPMLTLAGVPGTGKTHLAKAAAAALAERRYYPIYRTESGLIGEAMRRMKGQSTEALLDAVRGTHHLVLDDLGVAALSDWGKGVMDGILDARYEAAQKDEGWTLITTNVKGSDLSPRMRRRLHESGVSRVMELRAEPFFEAGS